MYADPSARRRTPASIRIGRNSSNLRPSRRRPSESISFISFSMCSMSSMLTLPQEGLGLLHRQLDALDLADAQDVTHDHVADLQVACGVAELDAPRRFRRVEGSWIG